MGQETEISGYMRMSLTGQGEAIEIAISIGWKLKSPGAYYFLRRENRCLRMGWSMS